MSNEGAARGRAADPEAGSLHSDFSHVGQHISEKFLQETLPRLFSGESMYLEADISSLTHFPVTRLESDGTGSFEKVAT